MSVDQVQQQKKKSSMSVLDQLKAVTVIVADTGDFEGNFITLGDKTIYRRLFIMWWNIVTSSDIILITLSKFKTT